jgi:hypothetical protein
MLEHAEPNIITEYPFLRSKIRSDIHEDDDGMHSLLFTMANTGVSIFTDAELVYHTTYGEYCDFHMKQIYKFSTYFVVINTYIGSCDGCISGICNEIARTNLQYVKQGGQVSTNDSGIMTYLEHFVAKASIYVTYDMAIAAVGEDDSDDS